MRKNEIHWAIFSDGDLLNWTLNETRSECIRGYIQHGGMYLLSDLAIKRKWTGLKGKLYSCRKIVINE